MTTPYPKTKRAKNPNTEEYTKKYYLTNSMLMPEVLKSKEVGKITEQLGVYLYQLANNYARRPIFNNYTYKDEMVSTALLNLCQSALKFNPEKSQNPFAFFTTCIHHSFLHYLSIEKKQRNIRDQLLIDAGANPSLNFMMEHERGSDYVNEGLAEFQNEVAEARERQEKQRILQAAKEAEEAALAAAQQIIEDQGQDIIEKVMNEEGVDVTLTSEHIDEA